VDRWVELLAIEKVRGDFLARYKLDYVVGLAAIALSRPVTGDHRLGPEHRSLDPVEGELFLVDLPGEFRVVVCVEGVGPDCFGYLAELFFGELALLW
jgi:hypothetical protein